MIKITVPQGMGTVFNKKQGPQVTFQLFSLNLEEIL